MKDNLSIQIITGRKRDCLSLLLLGDEQESSIDEYLARGELFALGDAAFFTPGDTELFVKDDAVVKAVCVVTDEGGGVLELQNIATDPRYQRQGYASRLIEHIAAHYKGRYDKLILGTGDVPRILAFYQHRGFIITHRVADYFTAYCDYPIIEDGVTLKDKVHLERIL